MRWSTFALIWLIAVAAWLAWAPLEFRSTEEVEFELVFAADLETTAHFFFLIPYAVAVAVLGSAGGGRFKKVAIQVVILATILELGQWWIRGRALSPYDLLLGIAGPLLAVWIFERQIRARYTPRRLLQGLLGAICILLLVGIVHTSLALDRGLYLTGWQANYEIVIGDEAGGERPYRGTVTNASICTAEDSDPVCINQESSTEEKRAFVALVEESQYVSVRATVRSDTDRQEGPARIVTFSNGPLERNVTLGQEGRDLVFRVRTPRSGLNGVDMQFSLPEAIESGKESRVAADFKEGALFLSSEADGATRYGSYRPRLLQSSLEVRGRGEARAPMVFLNRSGVAAFLLLLSGIAILFPSRGAFPVTAGGRAVHGRINDSTSPV